MTRGSPLVDRAIPLAVLIDHRTGGSAALLAAAIKEHRRGVLVGTRSGVSGGSGEVIALPGGTGMWIKTGRLTTGAGADLEARGVEPEVAVDLTMDDFDRAVDAQLQRAVQIAKQGASR